MVLLDQMVVRILRAGKGTEVESIDGREIQQLQIGCNRSVVPVRTVSFYRLRTRFQSLRSGRSQMSFFGLS